VKTSKGNCQTGIDELQARVAIPRPHTVSDKADLLVPKLLPIKKYAVSAKALNSAPSNPIRSKLKPFHTCANKIKPSNDKAIAPHIDAGTYILRTYLIHNAIQIGAVNSIIKTRLSGTPRWIPRK